MTNHVFHQVGVQIYGSGDKIGIPLIASNRYKRGWRRLMPKTGSVNHYPGRPEKAEAKRARKAKALLAHWIGGFVGKE